MVENKVHRVKTTPLRRLKMSRQTELLASPQDFGRYLLRPLNEEDSIMVGDLLFKSFRGSIDDEGQTRNQWRQLALSTFNRGICRTSSLVLLDGNVPICAMVVVKRGLHRERRSLDLAMTHPDYRGQGLAERLIRQCLHNLRETGIGAVSLWVTEQNTPALGLYRRLGFEVQEDFYYLKVVIT
ncbi:MAG: GNAT family N-acetyltransferase [Cyanobacteria bacterium SZAS LIN-5]|nr:GNAT family N-acetyltransferase [Cyanobacteria bacterium SZAS LIN-5]